MTAEPSMVRCVNCAMLCHHSPAFQNHFLMCFDQEFRRNTRNPEFLAATQHPPFCAANVVEKFHHNDAKQQKEAFLLDRDCPKFLAYVPALETPKAHIEMSAYQVANEAKQEAMKAERESAKALTELAAIQGSVRDWEKDQAEKQEVWDRMKGFLERKDHHESIKVAKWQNWVAIALAIPSGILWVVKLIWDWPK